MPKKRTPELEIHAVAGKLGVEARFAELWHGPWSEEFLHAVKNCDRCASTEECHLFLQGTVDENNNKHWWLKGFCPNARFLLELADEPNRGETED